MGSLAACGVGLEPLDFMTKPLDLSFLRFDQKSTGPRSPLQLSHQSVSQSRPSGARFVSVCICETNVNLAVPRI